MTPFEPRRKKEEIVFNGLDGCHIDRHSFSRWSFVYFCMNLLM